MLTGNFLQNLVLFSNDANLLWNGAKVGRAHFSNLLYY